MDTLLLANPNSIFPVQRSKKRTTVPKRTSYTSKEFPNAVLSLKNTPPSNNARPIKRASKSPFSDFNVNCAEALIPQANNIKINSVCLIINNLKVNLISFNSEYPRKSTKKSRIPYLHFLFVSLYIT